MSTVQIDTSYTQQVRALITLFYDPKEQAHCVVSDAKHYFENDDATTAKTNKLLNALATASNQEQEDNYRSHLAKIENKLTEQRSARIARLNLFIEKLLSLTDASSESETNTATAKFLGTLMLITDSNHKNFAKKHQLLKPLYKAALTLRLADGLLAKGNIKHGYLGKYIDSPLRYKDNPHWVKKWRHELAYPLIKAALLQDIGLYHPKAQKILIGENGQLDEFRLLQEKERKTLLKLNLTHSLAYLSTGLGIPPTKANTRQEKQQKELVESQALNFALETVQDATILKNHVGDLIKVPQIYTSFILSTKEGYDKKDLPKGYMVIEQLKKNGTLDKRIASCFLQMVGYFPQGFGVTYIATDDQGHPKDGYELAIVNRLYPSNPAEPHTRAVTRNLTYIKSGKDVKVAKSHNLYFQSNHKKIQRIDTTRLNQILTELTGGPQHKTADDLVPQYWEPSDFFSVKDNQNLWTGR